MFKKILPLLFLVQTCFGNLMDDNTLPLANTDAVSSASVEGVNTITGHLFDMDVDLVVPALQPLQLTRTHFSEPASRKHWSPSWRMVYEGTIHCTIDDERVACCYTDSIGSMTKYRGNLEGCKLDLRSDNNRGLSNAGRGYIGGKTNPKNTEVICKPVLKPGIVKKGDGTKESHWVHKWKNKRKEKYWEYMLGWVYHPSGYSTKYQYVYPDVKKISTILLFNPCGVQTDYITVSVIAPILEGEKKKHTKFLSQNFIACDGRQVFYEFERWKDEKDDRFYLKTVTRPNAPPINYTYWPSSGGKEYYFRLYRKELPDGRFVQYDYESDHSIQAIYRPDIEGKSVQFYRFKRTPYYDTNKKYNGGTCDVYDGENGRTRYHWDANDFMNQISRWIGGTIISKENFVWEKVDKAGKDIQHLKSHSLTNCGGTLFYKHDYDYDEKGNVLTDKFTGSLTGHSSDDHLTKEYTYSDDGFNNILTESNGRTRIEYTYFEGTDLITSKLIYFEDKIQKREFRTYDLTRGVSCLIEDDGSAVNENDLTSVTQRKIVRYTNRDKRPCYGYPSEILEMSLNLITGQEELLRKKTLEYSTEGWVTEEAIYDANNVLRFKKIYEYNNYGLPTKEIDPLGAETIKTYDANANLLTERKGEKLIHYTYDKVNQLLSKTVNGHTEKYTYDRRGLKTSVTDAYGCTTSFIYDDQKRQTETKFSDGTKQLTEYTEDGHPFKSTDEMGRVTTTVFNCYKKPLLVTKPDGQTTRVYYHPQGMIDEIINAEGVRVVYTYDGLDHIIAEDTFSREGELLSHKERCYQGTTLISETDPCGTTTYYNYDCHGRVISQICGNAKKTFFYDALGRLAEEQDHLENGDYLAHKIEYDNLDRLIEERWEDSAGNLLRCQSKTYDFFGNVSSETNGTSTTSYTYDILGRLIEVVDPANHRTTTIYGIKEKTKTTIDPLGLTTFEEFNSRDCLIRKTVSHNGEVLYIEENINDLCGRPIETKRTLANGESHVTRIAYDPVGRQIKYTQAADTLNESTIETTYDKLGNIICTTKADGVKLHYTYNDLQQVVSLQSSDTSVNYIFEYDPAGRLTRSIDQNTNLELLRSYDLEGRLLHETLPTGHTTDYVYDCRGRHTKITFDQSKEVNYRYDPLYLREVEYRNRTYCYHTFDIAGRLLAADTLTLQRDAAGRVTDYRSHNWEVKDIQYDGCNNLISYLHGGEIFDFSYEPLGQMTHEKGHNYSYNAFYNRISKDGASIKYNSQHQQTDFTYDKNGNLLSDKKHTYLYDALDRLIEVDGVSMTYDSMHRRLSKGYTTYLYQGELEVGSSDGEFRALGLGKLAESGAAVIVEWRHELYIPTHDLQGSLVALNNLQTQFTAYGEGLCPFPWGYQGKRFDPETDHYFFGRRYYNPNYGRWTTKDPAKDGFNHYAFVLNNPLAKFDAYGLYVERKSYGPDPFSFVWRSLWGGMEGISNHMIPLPGLSNVMGGVCRFAQTGNFAWNPSWYHPSCYELVNPGYEVRSDENQAYTNGVMCYYSEAKGQAARFSDLIQKPVWLCYSATHGFVQDLIGCVLQRCGVELQCERVAKRMINELTESGTKEAGLNLVGFSRGTMTTNNAAMSLDRTYRKEHVTAQGVGGAIRFNEKDFKHTKNYESTRDPVPSAFGFLHKIPETAGIAKPPDNVIILQSRATGMLKHFDHAYDSPTYRDAWKMIGENINDEW